MRKLIFLICLIVEFTQSIQAGLKMSVMLTPEQTDSLKLVELPSIGLALELGGDSLMVIGAETMPPLHIPAYEGARNLIATDSTMYCSEGHYIYAISPGGLDRTEVAVLDNDQFYLYPANGSTFLVVTTDELHADCLLFDPVAGVYTEIISIDSPIFKAVANDEHILVWSGNHILTVGENGQAVPIISDETIRDMVLAPSGLFVATEDGVLLFNSPVEAKVFCELPIQRLWYINETLYLLTDTGYLLALYSEPF